MSLFPCSSSISMSSLFKLEWTVEISVFFSLNCKCVMCQICWSLTMIVFFGKSISCFDLLMTGILKRWFIPDLKETMVSVVSNPSGSSVSFFSKSIGILLLILPKLTLHWMLISLLAGTMVVLGILRTKNSSWSVDWLMRLTSALICLELMSLTLRWSELIRAFSLPVLLTNTFIVMNPKIGLSSGSLITKKGTYNSSTVLLDSSDNSNFRSIHPRNGISVWLPHWSCSLSHGSNSSPTDKILTLVSYSPVTYVIAGTLEQQCQAKPVLQHHLFCMLRQTFHQLTGQLDLVLMEEESHFECLFCTHLLPCLLSTDLLHHILFYVVSTFLIDNFCCSNRNTGS